MRGEVRAIAPLYTDLIYSGFDALPELGEEVYTGLLIYSSVVELRQSLSCSPAWGSRPGWALF